MNRAFVRASALTSLVLAVGCMQDFDQFRGGGGAGTGGSGGIVDPCDGVDCNDDNPCTQDSCVDGTCQNVPGTATFPDPGDDCVDTICEEGVQRTVPDDNETPPSDGLECTADTCSAGSPVYTPTPGQPCGNGSVCNAAGQCSCNVASDCGTDPACGSWACEPAGCQLNLVPSNTTTPVEDNGTVGDCLALFCDADPDGNLVELPSSDPNVDGNQCTADLCMNGTPSNPNQPNGTSCSANGATPCNNCQCTGGQCCTTTAQACGARVCGMVANSCGNMVSCGTCSNPALPACTTAGACVQCTANGNCSGGTPVCKLTAPGANTCVQCLANGDCSGGTPVCNTTTNSCVQCTTNANCSGGTPVCKLTAPGANTCVACTQNSDCPMSSPLCNTTTNTCFGCGSDADCSGATPKCATSGPNLGTCVECNAVGDASPDCVGNLKGKECKANNTCGCGLAENPSADCGAGTNGPRCRDTVLVCGCNNPGDCSGCSSNVCP